MYFHENHLFYKGGKDATSTNNYTIFKQCNEHTFIQITISYYTINYFPMKTMTEWQTDKSGFTENKIGFHEHEVTNIPSTTMASLMEITHIPDENPDSQLVSGSILHIPDINGNGGSNLLEKSEIFTENIDNKNYHVLKSNWLLEMYRGNNNIVSDVNQSKDVLPSQFQSKATETDITCLYKEQELVGKIKSALFDEMKQVDAEDGFENCQLFNDCKVSLSVSGKRVTLFGTVFSWAQKEKVERIAWKTPGIWHVKNEIAINNYFVIND